MRYTQKQLAEMVGVSQVYISRIERGDVDSLTIRKLVSLSKALDVRPEHLLHLLLEKEMLR